MLFKLGNRGKMSIQSRERHAVSYVSVTRYLIVKEKAKIPVEPCTGRRPSWGDIQGHNSASQKVVNKTESSGQTNASNHSSSHCHLAELLGILDIPNKNRGGTLLRAQGEGQTKYESLISSREASIRQTGEAGWKNKSR